MKAVVIIPARYESSRLPGKPLIDLLGRSMIERTWRRCVEAFPREDVYVATDDRRIGDHCGGLGINIVMTSADCLTGTDRVAEAAQSVPAEIYINVQGDEPILDPNDLTRLKAAALEHPGEILNGVCPIDNEELYRSTSIPKVVMRPDGRLLYMTRGSVPANKAGTFARAWRQVCIYAFPPEALNSFARQRRKTPLEEIEDIEILRFLELGFDVRMIPMSMNSVSVDNPEDIAKAEEAIRVQRLQ
jgi:3-deoxy-manno-octulosonate cytidylyltransferase (CMP-KDO synthetase)